MLKKLAALGFCVVLTASATFAVKYIYRSINYHFYEKYDFSIDMTGPKPGESVPLARFKDVRGASFPLFTGDKIILLGIVDPDCGASRLAKDQIAWIREETKSENLEYVLVSFTSNDPEKFFDFTDTFSFANNSYLPSDPASLPVSFQDLVVPSHLLLDSNGNILRRFPGTNKEKSVRRKMATQVVKEVLEEGEKFRHQR